MATILDLPEDALHLIFQHLSQTPLKSAALAARQFTPVCHKYLYRTVTIDLWPQYPHATFNFIEHLAKTDVLKTVQRLVLNDSHERSASGLQLLQLLANQYLPCMLGLKSISWNVKGGAAGLPNELLTFLAENPKVNLFFSINSRYIVSVSLTLPSLIGCQNLQELALDLKYKNDAIHHDHITRDQVRAFTDEFKAVLLSCSRLRSLRADIRPDHPDRAYDSILDPKTWTAEECASVARLEELEWRCQGNERHVVPMWLRNDVAEPLESLQKLTLEEPEHLYCFTGKVPQLKTLAIRTWASWNLLLPCLADAPELEHLSLVMRRESESQNGPAVDNPSSILSLSCAASLASLELTRFLANGGPSAFNHKTIAHYCPHLTHLLLPLSSIFPNTSPEWPEWHEPCAQAVLEFPKLRSFALEIHPTPFGGKYLTITLSDAAYLWDLIFPTSPKIHTVALRVLRPPDESGISRDRMELFDSEVLTYKAVQPENDEHAADGWCEAFCPELEAAEKALREGRLDEVVDGGGYVDARKEVDRLISLVETGVPPKSSLTTAQSGDGPMRAEIQAEGSKGRRQRLHKRVKSALKSAQREDGRRSLRGTDAAHQQLTGVSREAVERDMVRDVRARTRKLGTFVAALAAAGGD